jgi:hypothetical protein
MTNKTKIALVAGIGVASIALFLASKKVGAGTSTIPSGQEKPPPTGGGAGSGNQPQPDPEFAQWVKQFITDLRNANVRQDASEAIDWLVNKGLLTQAQGSGAKYNALYILLDHSKAYGEQMADYRIIYDMISTYNGNAAIAIAAFSVQKYSFLKPDLLPESVAKSEMDF